ncbi:MAG: M20/M25/M40 family metallo-hydrolase [Alphaproteobacteria bacterium]|jgi:succinyl-diaminopimelate desuccinylase|nr:M20/M25/M40 family metallo-hydrolase [Alphaproteobacteria bacterium]
MVNDNKATLLDWIEADRDQLIGFLKDFVATPSPNPPGDTRAATAHITSFLEAEGLPFETVAPNGIMPNLVGNFEGGAGPGRHLVLNGHIDVFPVGDPSGWSADPWGGEIREGKLYGRGAADMKAGTTASIFTYRYLYRLRDRLRGRLTLTCVSDEETFGPWGARYLIEHRPDVRGDALLNGEPGSPLCLRFGEKGPLWVAFTVRTDGAHGAYTHLSEGAVFKALRVIEALRAVEELEPSQPSNIAQVIAASAEAHDAAMGAGAAEIVPRVTLNIGLIEGGAKVNMVPGACRFEADFRLPIGIEKEQVLEAIEGIVANFDGIDWEEMNFTAPSWCDPDTPLAEHIRAAARKVRGHDLSPSVSLGATDARLWRYLGIPAYIYGPFPHGMGGVDEHVEIEEFLDVVKVHALAALDYLSEAP